MPLTTAHIIFAASMLGGSMIAFAPGAPNTTPSETTGTASFYSSRYDGRLTASGERFNSSALTAASRDLPLGTRVKITNLANGRSVIVLVNDRGPYVRNRIISVTLRAARELGFVEAGTAQVRIEPIR